MTIIPPIPNDISQCELYKKLIEKSQPKDGLAEKVNVVISETKPLLDLILAGPFREYTLHNQNHAIKLVHLAGHIIDQATLEKISALEIAIIIMSCYLHDSGMILTSDDREKILSDQLFLDELENWPQLSQEISITRKKHSEIDDSEQMNLLETKQYQLQEAALANYLRPRHAIQERYQAFFQKIKKSANRNDLFEIMGISFEADLIDICCSHNLDTGVLLESKSLYVDRFPREHPISQQNLNSQFCAAILRIVDILDFDRERTPRVLFESLGFSDSSVPGRSISIREWNKHMSIHSLDIGTTEIIVSAESTHPAIEKSIKDFCDIIEREIRDTLSVLRKNPSHITETYTISLPTNVRANIHSVGYIYKDLSFKLDESAISSLLMGESLYANKSIALREIVQNAIDACQTREAIAPNSRLKYEVKISAEEDAQGHIWLIISDNGIGMDEFVISEYFFRIGNSYYKSPEFQRLNQKAQKPFVPISRFGIGILSVFMICDMFEVFTRNNFSPRGDIKHRTIHVEGRFGLATLVEDNHGSQGTVIRLRLISQPADMAWNSIYQHIEFLRKNITRPAVNIAINLPKLQSTIRTGTYMELAENARQQLAERKIEVFEIDVEKFSERIKGKIILFLYKDENGLLSHSLGMRYPKLNANDMVPFLTNYGGNQITVNGITMSLKKLSLVFGTKARRLPGVIDVEVVGNESIQYDVSRTKLVGIGAIRIRKELQKVLKDALETLGILARMSSSTQQAVKSTEFYRESEEIRPFRPLEDEEILNAVKELLPVGEWPLGIHRIIGEKLKITPSICYRAISTLIANGSVHHVTKKHFEISDYLLKK